MIKHILLLLLLVASTAALADVRIVTLNKSLHFAESKLIPHNETHHGIGLEVAVREGLYLGVMQFENSFYQRSNMLSLTAEYDGWGGSKWGPMAAVADGYGKRGDKYLMIAGVSVRYKWLRITITPVLIAAGLVFEIN